MPYEPFRFLHAGDLHLEQPPHGLAEVPDHLRQRLIDAPYAAAVRLFDLAISEKVDFLVLSGDVLDPHAVGARALLFLNDQFLRLAERQIEVYWAPGEVDPPERWPHTVDLPANVHLLTPAAGDEIIHRRKDRPLAHLLGVNRVRERDWRAETLTRDSDQMFTVVAAHVPYDSLDTSVSYVEYWALGGKHQRATPTSMPRVVHYSGTTQARHPEETGSHGCTLVQIDVAGKPYSTFVPLDSVRFYAETLAVDDALTREQIWHHCRQRMATLATENLGVTVLVEWQVTGHGTLFTQLRRTELAAELLEKMRTEFGHGEKNVWATGITCQPDEELPEALFEQETMLGDYLRAVRGLARPTAEALDLSTYVHESIATGLLSPAFRLGQSAARERVLREAASLGVDLLSGESRTLRNGTFG